MLARAALSQMDVPTRSSYVMAIAPPSEQAAAASVTSVPRSLASAVGPLLAGYLLGVSPFGWPCDRRRAEDRLRCPFTSYLSYVKTAGRNATERLSDSVIPVF